MPVRLCLAALPGQPIEAIERVYSHIQALGQAEAFLRSRPWMLADDLQHGRRRQGHRASGASVARRPSSRRAPRRCFGLEILADDIQAICPTTGPGSS